MNDSLSDSLGEGKGKEKEGNSIHPSLPTAEDQTRELTARRAVVHAVRHIRRWDEPGILAEWDKAAKAGHNFVAVAVCLLETAADPTAQTPAVVRHRLANGWRRDIEPPTPLPQIPQCGDCHLRHAPDTPCGDIGGAELPAEYIEARASVLDAIRARSRDVKGRTP